MRISFILSSLRLSGGVRVVTQYANRLSKRGHHISLVIPNGTIDAQLTGEIDPEIKIITTKHKLEPSPNLLQLFRISWEMAKSVPKSDVIIATHTPTTVVSFLAGKLLGRGKIIWYYMDYAEMFDARPIEQWFLRNALKWHAYAVTLSEACVQELHTYSSGVVINIGLGIDTAVYHPQPLANKSSFSDPDRIAIFFLGDARPRKGMAEFLNAMEKLSVVEPNLMMWIASKEDIKLQCTIPFKLFFRPTDTELAVLYSACDLFVSASWYEGFGLPPLEAMACGAAVVTTDSRGIHEFAIDGENCLIVPPKNPEALAEGLQLLLANQGLMKKFKMNGPLTAAKFDWKKATDRFEAALRISETDK
ncbi:MAG: glycosyltransferase family 4 protein [Anaerolineales bacterium]